MVLPRPNLLANSLSAPSGHSTPHHTRPMNTMLTSTNGHQMPQKQNCEIRVRLDQICAVSSGKGKKIGTRMRMAYTSTTTHWMPRINAPLRRIQSPVRARRVLGSVQVLILCSLLVNLRIFQLAEGGGYHKPINDINGNTHQGRTRTVAGQRGHQAT